MKVLFIITGLGMGGAERVLVNLADKMLAQGHHPMIVSLTGPTLVTPNNKCIRIESLEMRKSPMDFIRVYFTLRRIIKEYQPDVLHSHMVHANLVARLLRFSIPISRLICTAHSSDEGGWIRTLAYRLTDSLADITTNVSRRAADIFIAKGAVPNGRIMTIYNGINCDLFSPGDNQRSQVRTSLNVDFNSTVFIAIGRMYEAKDYPNLLHAFSKVSSLLSNSCLWIVGDGPLRSEIHRLSNSLGLNDQIRFLGVRQDINELLRAADIFVLSSSWEGFGLVVAEAMATEKIVVATDCGGVGEVVGDCGFLVPPGDASALSSSLINAASLSDEESRLLGIRARRRIIENFSLDKMTDRYLELYVSSSI